MIVSALTLLNFNKKGIKHRFAPENNVMHPIYRLLPSINTLKTFACFFPLSGV